MKTERELIEEHDEKIREILHIGPDTVGDCIRTICSLDDLKRLDRLCVLDKSNAQNYSPTIGDFMYWCEEHETGPNEVCFEAYYITHQREGARIYVEGICLDKTLAAKKTQQDFIAEFRHADEFSGIYDDETRFRAWWD